MTKTTIAGSVFGVLLLLVFALTLSRQTPGRVLDASPKTPSDLPRVTSAAAEAHAGFLYGRITTGNGATFEGRLRFGGDEEAFWSDSFNGYRAENPWASHVPTEQLVERTPIEIFGVRIAQRERSKDLSRPFMARFGDLARIEVSGRDILVTLKSGTAVRLDRLNADDLADGVRVWDARRGVVNLEERQIQSVELLSTARLEDAPDRLYGTVHTRHDAFTGFLQWNREQSVGTDELSGRTADGELSLRFDTIRSIARTSGDSSRVLLEDGRELLLSGTREVGEGHRGVYVDDPRFGRVLVYWNVFERVDLGRGDSGPAYDDFPPGRPLTGSVTTRSGRRLEGRLVYDLDESETTETLDAPARGIHYAVPFRLIASIVPGDDPDEGSHTSSETSPEIRVSLRGGEELSLEPRGDLGELHGGMLIFVDGVEPAEYVPWKEVARVDFERPDS